MSEPGTRVAHAGGSTALPPVAPLAPAAHDPLARAIRAVLVGGCLMVLSISRVLDPSAGVPSPVLRGAAGDPGGRLPPRRDTGRGRPVARAAAVRALGQHARRFPRGPCGVGPLPGLPRAGGAVERGAGRLARG